MAQAALKLAVVMAVAAGIGFMMMPSPRQSVLGRIVRSRLGEPLAAQGVNDAADLIISGNWQDDLSKLADNLIKEFEPTRESLPYAFMGGRSIPIDRLPAQYRQLAGQFSDMSPELVFRPKEHASPARIIIDWAHLRHAIIIYTEAPKESPRGFYVRKVNDRIFVVAGES
jgi:hypothetical protein